MDLYLATPAEIRALMLETEDPEVLRSLAKLEEAASTEDYELQTEAIGELSDLLVLERGL